jgi:hypothetical protein
VPEPEPLPFDAAHAHATAEVCERLASRLADARRAQGTDAVRAAEGWRGPRRDHFDLRLAHTTRRSEQLESTLRALADELRAVASREQTRA